MEKLYKLPLKSQKKANICIVCDSNLSESGVDEIFDYFGYPYGWKCPNCDSLFNNDDKLIFIGGFNETKTVRA
jgi:uncharacterized CHY-type Zn-finger protein